MKQSFLVLILLFYSLFSQELNKKQMREYRNKRIIIEAYTTTSSHSSMIGDTPIVISSGSSAVKWRPKIFNKTITESKFYNLVKEDDYYNQAKNRENAFSTSMFLALVPFALGLTIMFIDTDYFLAGLSIYGITFIPLFYGLYLSLKPSIVDIETARELSAEYNKSLKLKISKKF